MSASGAAKTQFVAELLRIYSEQFQVVTLQEHCRGVVGHRPDTALEAEVSPTGAGAER